MTQQEFEQRIGREVSIEEYAKADAVYMASSLEKDEFCRDYKDHDCELMQNLADRANTYEDKSRTLMSDRIVVGERLAKIANDIDNEDIRQEARHLLTLRDYVRLCIEEGYKLTDIDLDYVYDHIG